MRIIRFLVMYLCLIMIFFGPPLKPHQCTWEDCDLRGKYMFRNTWGCEEYTDCYLCLKAHYDNPRWSYEQCEAYVFDIPVSEYYK